MDELLTVADVANLLHMSKGVLRENYLGSINACCIGIYDGKNFDEDQYLTITDYYVKDVILLENITEQLYNEGFRNKKGSMVSPSSIRHILQNPIYIGKFNYSGKQYVGTHQPIVTEELFNKVQENSGKKQTKNAVLYAMNTVRDDNLINLQINKGMEFAEKMGYKVTNIFTDNEKSTRTLERPALQKMIEFCKNSKNKVDAIIVWRLDRLFRNFADYIDIRTTLLEKHKIKLLSVTNPNIDTFEVN